MARKSWLLVLGSILALHLVLLLNIKFTAWPEMLAWPYLIIKGLLPYKDIAVVHTPFLLGKLALFYSIFGVGVAQLKAFTWLLILVFDLLVFLVVKKMWGIRQALISVLVFAVWQTYFDGNGLWFDLFMGFFALITFYFVQKKNFLWAGIFWGLAFLTKQTAIYFLIPIIFGIVQSTEYKAHFFVRFGLGASIVFVCSAAAFWLGGILPSFYHWAINFGVFVLPRSVGQISFPDLRNLAAAGTPFLVFIPLFIKNRNKALSIFLWALAGSLGAYPRFELFHFQPALPYLAIATTMVITKVDKKIIVVYFLACFIFLFSFFVKNWHEGVRFYDQSVIDVADYVRQNTGSGDKIFVVNWWDSIYALSDRLPATDPLIPQLPWYQDLADVQGREVENLENNRPKMIILQPYTASGLSSYIPNKIHSYIVENYSLKSMVDGIEIYTPN